MSFRAVVLPGDDPPRRSRIKRLLLFSDSVAIIHPTDKAVVNAGEISERFPDMTIQWSERSPFPKNNDYDNVMELILSETVQLQRAGRILVLKQSDYSDVDPGINWVLHQSSLSNEVLVRAAIPDLDPSKPEPKPPAGIYVGMAMAQSGCKSKYDIPFKPPFEIPGQSRWSGYAWARLGRALKFIRRAYGIDSFPIALDPVNDSILKAVGSLSMTKPPSPGELVQMTIATWMEPEKLEAALVDMSWNEVMGIRRELLPTVDSLRESLVSRVQALGVKTAGDEDSYVREFSRIRQEYESKQEKLAEAWEKLKIGGALKIGGQ